MEIRALNASSLLTREEDTKQRSEIFLIIAQIDDRTFGRTVTRRLWKGEHVFENRRAFLEDASVDLELNESRNKDD